MLETLEMVYKIRMLVMSFLLLPVFNTILEDEVLTFTTSDSFVRVVGYEGSYNVNMSMQIRTWQAEGVLVFHKFSSRGYLKVFLHEGLLSADIISSEKGSTLTTLEHHDTVLNDGKWHSIHLFIAQAVVGLTVNTSTVTSSLPALIRTGGLVCPV